MRKRIMREPRGKNVQSFGLEVFWRLQTTRTRTKVLMREVGGHGTRSSKGEDSNPNIGNEGENTSNTDGNPTSPTRTTMTIATAIATTTALLLLLSRRPRVPSEC